jgi:hypothetical protein
LKTEYNCDETTARFKRVSIDDPSHNRRGDVFDGPYSRPTFFRLHKWVTGVTLLLSIVGTLAMISGALK